MNMKARSPKHLGQAGKVLSSNSPRSVNLLAAAQQSLEEPLQPLPKKISKDLASSSAQLQQPQRAKKLAMPTTPLGRVQSRLNVAQTGSCGYSFQRCRRQRGQHTSCCYFLEVAFKRSLRT